MKTLNKIEKIGQLTVAIIFILSGSLPLFWSDKAASIQLLDPFGWPYKWNLIVFYTLIVTDITLGILALFFRHMLIWLTMLAVTLGYTLIISIYIPSLWLDPLSSLPKNIPIISWLLILIVLNQDAGKSINPQQGEPL